MNEEAVSMAGVSVIIPNYNGSKYLRDCLASLNEAVAEYEHGEAEIIIVDNASTDDGIEIIKECCPAARLIMLDRNYGFSRAVNEGIRASRGKYVILLNNDTRVFRDFISRLAEAIGKDDGIFSVSSRMLKMSDPELIDSAGDMYCCLGWAFARGKDRPSSEYDKKAEIFSACAGAAIYRRSVFDEIGYFDEEHFAYLEDVDIGYRARINGYRNFYEPSASVYHAGSGISGSRYNRFKIDLSSRNNVYVAYKNMPLLQLVLNLPFLAVGTFVKTLFFAGKGEGLTYIRGLGKGLMLCVKGRKYPFRNENLGNYIRIQFELWRNMFIRFLG